jgi:phenylacetaldehyde dehydrogenase
VGPGIDPQTQMGPLVSQEQLDRVCGFLESGQTEGAETLAGGKRKGDRGYFVEPTVLAGTNPQMKVEAEEIFGPVVTVRPFKDPSELVGDANNTAYGLAAGVWTSDLSKAHRTAKSIKAGTVWINCYNVFDAALPFGGYKESGWGREMGAEALELYTEVKSVVTHLG